MTKITLTPPNYKSEALITKQLSAVTAATTTLGELRKAGIDTDCIEVIKISFATWAPNFDHLWIEMVLSTDGKKQDPSSSVVQDPTTVDIKVFVADWIKKQLLSYLQKQHEAFVSKTKGLDTPISALSAILTPLETEKA